MKNFKLLPYRIQFIGWTLAFIGLIIFLLTLLKGYDLYQIGFCIFEVGFLVLAFTKEKDEDERVQAIRLKSLAITAIIYVAAWILKPVFQTWIVRFFSLEQCAMIFNIMALINMIPLYVLIFKSALYIQNKQLSYDK